MKENDYMMSYKGSGIKEVSWTAVGREMMESGLTGREPSIRCDRQRRVSSSSFNINQNCLSSVSPESVNAPWRSESDEQTMAQSLMKLLVLLNRR